MKKIIKLLSIFTALLITIFAGCNRSDRPADLPQLTPCTLTVTAEDGVPVEGALVQLLSDQAPASLWNAGGITGPEGKLIPLVQGKWPGVVPGTYKVMVKKFNVVKEKEFLNTETGKMTVIQKNIPLIDPAFGKPDQTPLSLTIGTGAPVDEKLTVKLAK